MPAIKYGDKCADCKNCHMWSSDYHKATCYAYGEQGFNPERPVPGKCIGMYERKY